jgi:hypothetical protein
MPFLLKISGGSLLAFACTRATGLENACNVEKYIRADAKKSLSFVFFVASW